MGSSAAEKVWASIVREVEYTAQAAAEGSDAESSGAAHNISVHLIRLDEQPPYPRATWKKLVSDLKVPIKLSTICKEIQLQHPKSAALVASISALEALLAMADQDGVLQPSTQLCAAILQQLRQSGLLQHLADIMINTAGELALAAQSAASEVEPPGSMSPVSEAAGASSSTSSRGCHNNRGLSSMQQAERLEFPTRLLVIVTAVCRMIPTSDHTYSTLPAAAYTAAVQLAYTGLQHISAVLPLLQQGQQGQHQQSAQQQAPPAAKGALWSPNQIDTAWLNAGNFFLATVWRLLTFISNSLPRTVVGQLQEVPDMRPLLLSPDMLPVFAAMVAAVAVGLAAKQDRGSSSSSTSSSTCSDGSNRQAAKQLQLELSLAQLQLCHVLGVSCQTLLWTTGAIGGILVDRHALIQAMQPFIFVYCSIVKYYMQHVTDIPSIQLLQMAEIDLLLPSFVLPWLDSIPTSSPDWGMQCQQGSVFCGEGYSTTREAVRSTEWGPCVLPGMQRGDAASHTLQQRLQQPPSRELLVEVLPVVVRLCMARLQQLQQSPQSGGVQEQEGTTRSKGSAATSSLAGSSLSAQPDAVQWRTKVLLNWVLLLQRLLSGCSCVVVQQAAPSSSIGSSHGRVVRHPVLASQDVFRQQAADLFTVLEGVVRYAAVSTPSNNSRPPTVSAAATIAAGAAVANLCQGGLQPGSRPAALSVLAREAGPGFQTQQHLYSMLCSLAKVSEYAPVDFRYIHAPLRVAVAEAALMLLVAPTPDAIAAFEAASAANAAVLWAKQPVVATAAVEKGVGSVVAAAANALAAGAVKALDVLPSLVIMGRCCLQLPQELEAGGLGALTEQSLTMRQTCAQNSARTMCCRKLGQMSRMEYFVLLVQQWLQGGSHSAELSAAGYATEAVLQELEQLLAAVRARQVTGSSGSSGERGTPDAAADVPVTKQLRSTGLALYALAVPCMCNYPGCTNLSGLTELGTVSCRTCMCGGCCVARYCSRAHQKKHWKQHKPVCAALAAAGAAVVPAAAPV